jgi:DNA-binding response OmpR family regulator
LVILDLGLPDFDGEVVLAQLRRVRPWVPVIVLTARDDVETRVTALDQGAEDYVIKPFDLAELMARVRLRLRRPTANGDAKQPEAPTTLQKGRISLDRLERVAMVSGESVVLTPQEYAVLEQLMLHAEDVVSRTQLLRSVWGMEQAPRRSNLVDVAVASLRRRIGATAIETVRGEGYRFLG